MTDAATTEVATGARTTRLLWTLLGLACAASGCGGDQDRGEARALASSVPVPSASVRVEVDSTRDRRPISPLIYGINGAEHLEGRRGVFTFLRLGGNRTTTYNWENNASNAGSDYHHMNDAFFGASDEPGAYVRDFVTRAHGAGAAALVTVPLVGRIAADKREGADVRETPNFQQVRFVRSEATGPGPPAVPPDVTDGVVYQDAFVRFLEDSLPRSAGSHRGLFYSLDNEPGAWVVAHPRIRGGDGQEALTYREHLERSVRYARAIRAQAPTGQIFGPASFGFPDFITLGAAPDAGDRDYIDVYLDRMAREEREGGTRLLDVFDVHFYPSTHVEGVPVANSRQPAARALRMQVPRSLYDGDYREASWIVDDYLHEPIRLLPRLRETLDAHYPGTKLAVTEYHYGGGADVSGAIAQADVLGAYGRHGLYAAALWPLWGEPQDYVLAAFDMYRRAGGAFGAVSVPVRVPDVARVNAWASTDEDDGRVVLVVVHRATESIDLEIAIRHGRSLGDGRAFVLDGAAPAPRRGGAVERLPGGRYRLRSTGPSVTTLVFDASPAR